MFGVIVCPSCATAQGADLSQARVSCVRCGQKIVTQRAKVYFSSESSLEVAEAVRNFSQRQRSKLEEWDNAVDVPRTASTAPKVNRAVEDEVQLRSVVQRLTLELGAFGPQELATALNITDQKILDALIDRMLVAGIIYEVSIGRYKAA